MSEVSKVPGVAGSSSGWFGEQLLEEKLRIRSLARSLHRDWSFDPHGGTTRGEYNADFSRFVAKHGLVGIALPQEYGGQGRPFLDRYLLTEELLAVGAPMAAHWGGERQVAPGIAHYGSESLQKKYLPGTMSGETFFSVGFSEPDAGSDLGGITTIARKVEGGWRITGRKIWTSDAQRNQVLEVLSRTDRSGGRHEGFTSFMVDLPCEGVEIRPVQYMNGDDFYAEVVLEDAFVSDDQVLGEVGGAWSQMTSELTYERAGAERYMAVYPLIEEILDEAKRHNMAEDSDFVRGVGEVVAHFVGLRMMGLALAHDIDAGRAPSVAASLLKDSGTLFEQDVVEWAREAISRLEAKGSDVSGLRNSWEKQLLKSPLYTLGGGATEILKAGIGKKVVRGAKSANVLLSRLPFRAASDEISEAVGSIFSQFDITSHENTDLQSSESAEAGSVWSCTDRLTMLGWRPRLWSHLCDNGWAWATLPEHLSGGGATVADACAVLESAGWHGISVPLAESLLPAAAMFSDLGQRPSEGAAVAVSTELGAVTLVGSDGDFVELKGSIDLVPWAPISQQVLALVDGDGGRRYILVAPTEALQIRPNVDLAAQPTGAIDFASARISRDCVHEREVSDSDATRYVLLHALSQASLIQGAAQRVIELTLDYARSRKQFGKPIGEFQLIQSRIVSMLDATLRAQLVLDAAASSSTLDEVRFPTLVHTAKFLANVAAGVVARNAHQVHGGIGTAMEFPLHLLTRRLWLLRDRAGTETDWGQQLGRELCQVGAKEAWQKITQLS